MSAEFNPALYADRQYNESDIRWFKEVFDSIDSNRLGYLEPKDVTQFLQEHGYMATRETIYDIIAQHDAKQTGRLSFSDFVKLLKCRPAECVTRKKLKKVFAKYDSGNKGYVGTADLMQVAEELHQKLDKQAAEAILKKVGKGDKLNFEDFYSAMTNQTYYQ